MNGKGDTQRPCFVPEELVRLRWEYAFRKDHPNIDFDEWLTLRNSSKERTDIAPDK